MDASMKIDLKSWRSVAEVFEDAADGVPSMVERVVAHTTNPAACGAAEGLATVDGAVAIMLSVFGELMNATVLPAFDEGLRSEAGALVATGEELVNMEQAATELATHALD